MTGDSRDFFMGRGWSSAGPSAAERWSLVQGLTSALVPAAPSPDNRPTSPEWVLVIFISASK